jgi:glycosyltransferase involved in cell wall biosynthesis
MVGLSQVSGRAMGQTGTDAARNVILWLPSFSEDLIMKDPGQISEHLADKGYDVKIVCYGSNAGSEIPRNVGKASIEAIQCSRRVFCSVGIPLFLYLFRNRRNVDCLILYFPSLVNVVASVLFRFFNRRGVCIIKMDSDGRLYRSSGYIIKQFSSKERGVHYEGVASRTPLLKRIILRIVGEVRFRILSWAVDLLIIESPEARQRVVKIHPWLRHKLIVLPNGINIKKFDELSKSVRDEREKKILCVGRVEHAKGVDLIVAAFSRLKDKYQDWTLELVGGISPSFQSHLKDMITKDLESKVILAGPLYGRELAERYRSSKIFCFASRSESFGIVLVEAMYFENAVISSDVGAASYILDYGNAGLIFEAENIDRLTVCMDSLMGDETFRNRLATAAKLRCEELFNWVKIVDDLDHYICNISGSRRSRVHSPGIGDRLQ